VTNSYNGLARLATQVVGTSGGSTTTTSYSYDGAGNLAFESTVTGGQTGTSNERRSYYGADDRVIAVDGRSAGRRMFDEFRYDALGRRIWVRTDPICQLGPTLDCLAPRARRTVWDGGQELAEIQAPYDSTNLAWQDQDGGWPLRQSLQGDPNPFYGRVVYGPGLAVDQPLSITRYEYRSQPSQSQPDLTWPPFTWILFPDYRASPVYGLFSDGAWAKPHTLAPGQTTCPLVGPNRCVLFQWPLAQAAYHKNRGKVQFPAWHGTLLEHKRDGAGLEYARNRVYDPATGRFTQEDPIRLGDGLNLYSFAAGGVAYRLAR
jgi:RHS repeat-associated protein